MVSLVNHIVYAKMFRSQESSAEAKKLKYIKLFRKCLLNPFMDYGRQKSIEYVYKYNKTL